MAHRLLGWCAAADGRAQDRTAMGKHDDSAWAWEEILRLHGARNVSMGEGREAIVLAGGSGTRLQRLTSTFEGTPLPKQFCAFGGQHTLLQQTVLRTGLVVDAMRTTVVVQREHAGRATSQLSAFPGVDLVVQPGDGGTGIGLLYPLVQLAVRRPTSTILVTPADHGFSDAGALARTLEIAFDAVSSSPDRIVVVGAEPDRAVTDYGWIDAPGSGRFRPVERFVEKPPADVAAALFSRGAAWNTMLMVASARALVELFAATHPRVLRMFLFQAALPADERLPYLEAAYAGMPKLDLSREVLGRATNLSLLELPVSAGWSDLGTEDRMGSWLAAYGRIQPPASGPVATRKELEPGAVLELAS
jgi:mannose-1-phosphate guanylyltransferase